MGPIINLCHEEIVRDLQEQIDYLNGDIINLKGKLKKIKVVLADACESLEHEGIFGPPGWEDLIKEKL